MNVIQTDSLTKWYGRSRGIIDLTFSITEGEIFGLIGPNGAGKTTLLRTLLGLIQPSSGSASIFGLDIIRNGPRIREEIGYLPSEVFYYDDMRVIDLLNYSASFYQQPKEQMTRRINELAELLDLDLKKKIDNLSYGNKKKVGIVQGLLHNPKLVILDEPTSGLDPLMQQVFFNLIREENQRGTTVLFSSHILSEVQRLCDRVAIIKDGRIIATEVMSELRDNNYKRCTLDLNGPVDEQSLQIEGVSDLTINRAGASFLYQGDINILMRRLATLNLRNAWIEEPDLDEVFLHFYTKDV